jgi:hypothetical protein
MPDDWSYIKFPPFNYTPGWVDQSDAIDSFRGWLEEWGGVEDYKWYWHRGDRFAKGVYIKDADVAIMFRLRFDV